MATEAHPGGRFKWWLLAERIEQVEGPETAESKARPAALVEGGMPHRGGLLLDPWLHTRHRRTGSRGPLPIAMLLIVALTLFAMVPMYRRGSRGESARSGLDIYAREAALVLAG